MLNPRFLIRPGDRVASAGSCFAQHIAGYLLRAGIEPFVAEEAPPMLDRETAKHFQFGLYSARYGNIYTPRQLLQLLQRAFGDFTPQESAWCADGRYIDPYRPSIQGDGFYSIAELELDRAQHLACVRRMFEQLDVFIFTLGLTEAWLNKADGAVYPVCPGCGWGEFGEQYGFANFTVEEVEADLLKFSDGLRLVNPRSKIILTVSPVPLVATAEDQHVLSATTYSKSVLRVAAERVKSLRSFVEYFPSYEIITGPHARGEYYDDDLRSIRPHGVDHVMKVFSETFLQTPAADAPRAVNNVPGSPPTGASTFEKDAFARIAGAICEEEALDRDD